MTINGLNIDFDMDIRKDNARFVKAFQDITKKQEKGQITDNDMEMFLIGCLKSEQAKELLKDGRISTLVKAFTAFFSEAIEQFSVVSNAYTEVADSLASMKDRVTQIFGEYKETRNRLDSFVPVDNGE